MNSGSIFKVVTWGLLRWTGRVRHARSKFAQNFGRKSQYGETVRNIKIQTGGQCYRHLEKYDGVSKSFWTDRLERELQMLQLSAARSSCIAILWVSLVSFAAITICVASQRVFIVISVYFVIDSVRKLLDKPSCVVSSAEELTGWQDEYSSSITQNVSSSWMCPECLRESTSVRNGSD
jgi:hypothetical protein